MTWTRVDDLLGQGAKDGLFAGAALVVRTRDDVLHEVAVGHAELRPRERKAQLDTPWDVASLTKVLAITPLCMAFIDEGFLDPEAPLEEILPGAPPGITAKHCLQHTSGLADWAPLYERVIAEGRTWGAESTREEVFRWAYEGLVQAPPGTRYRYSDLGFLLLTHALEALAEDRLDRLWDHYVRARGELDLRWGWPDAAATEDCPVRQRVVVGEVHDLNAAVLGGISGHAGLFGSVREVAAAAAWQLRAYHGEETSLRADTVRAFMRMDSGLGSHRLGWDGVTPGSSSAGPRWPLTGVGHTGFTGCSLWMAPEEDVIVALLTNRVHPVVEGGSVPSAPISPRYQAFRSLRPVLHTLVVEALEGLGQWNDSKDTDA